MRMSLGGVCYDNAAMSCEILIYTKERPETVTESSISDQYFA